MAGCSGLRRERARPTSCAHVFQLALGPYPRTQSVTTQQQQQQQQHTHARGARTRCGPPSAACACGTRVGGGGPPHGASAGPVRSACRHTMQVWQVDCRHATCTPVACDPPELGARACMRVAGGPGHLGINRDPPSEAQPRLTGRQARMRSGHAPPARVKADAELTTKQGRYIGMYVMMQQADAHRMRSSSAASPN